MLAQTLNFNLSFDIHLNLLDRSKSLTWTNKSEQIIPKDLNQYFVHPYIFTLNTCEIDQHHETWYVKVFPLSPQSTFNYLNGMEKEPSLVVFHSRKVKIKNSIKEKLEIKLFLILSALIFDVGFLCQTNKHVSVMCLKLMNRKLP